MRAAYVLTIPAALMSACQSQESEPLSSCVGQFKDVRDGLALNGKDFISDTRKLNVVYTYDISGMKDADRKALLRQQNVLIDAIYGGVYDQTERQFMKKPVTDAPRALLAEKSLYRVRHSARKTSDATITFGCGLLGEGARLTAIDVTA